MGKKVYILEFNSREEMKLLNGNLGKGTVYIMNIEHEQHDNPYRFIVGRIGHQKVYGAFPDLIYARLFAWRFCEKIVPFDPILVQLDEGLAPYWQG